MLIISSINPLAKAIGHIEWEIGQASPLLNLHEDHAYEYMKVVATGPELSMIRQNMFGIRDVANAYEMTWVGDDAAFIINNLMSCSLLPKKINAVASC